MAEGMDNPFFARWWTLVSRYEPAEMRRLRREMLAGLSGRVLEVGAGTGSNFGWYPSTVHEVVALEPERRLRLIAERSVATAAVPVTVAASPVEELEPDQPFDAVICSLVLCSVDQPETVLRHLLTVLRPGGQLRYLEHVASGGMHGRLQRIADATLWPRMFGNCHTHRDTERAIGDAGFTPQSARRVRHGLPPVNELVLGTAIRPCG